MGLVPILFILVMLNSSGGPAGPPPDPEVMQAWNDAIMMGITVYSGGLAILALVALAVTALTGGLTGGPYQPSCGDQ